MTGTLTNGDRIPIPGLVVCLDSENRPLPRISPENAEMLHARGWACWIGRGSRRHLRLTPDAPLALLAHGWHGRDGTRPIISKGGVRPDGTPSLYNRGQYVGDPIIRREFIPLPN